MIILAIDPGTTKSAMVYYSTSTRKPMSGEIQDNQKALYTIEKSQGFDQADRLVIEQVACMGMAVGEAVFETVFWSGRFAQAWGEEFSRLKRHAVKMHMCGNARARDANIRQAVIDRYREHPELGGGKVPEVGTKKAPGPLFGIHADLWQALALAITFHETVIEKEDEA